MYPESDEDRWVECDTPSSTDSEFEFQSDQPEQNDYSGLSDQFLEGIKLSQEFIDFIHDHPTVFHAVDYFANLLKSNGYEYLPERSEWKGKIQYGGKYFTTRNGSALIAFKVGSSWKFGQGLGIVGCHVDANSLKLKPVSKKSSVDGFRQLGAAFYGGPNTDTWWDRDLGLGGRAIVRATDKDGKKKVTSKLVNFEHPIARIPSLAMHFGAAARGPFNSETQMTPVVGLTQDSEAPQPHGDESDSPIINKHDLALLRKISRRISVPLKDILQLELELFDFQKGAIGGLDQEFVFCPRLDDKLCSFAAIKGLLQSGDAGDAVNIVALFDDEEVGSLLRQGARGGLLEAVVDRLFAKSDEEQKRLSYANSFLISSDVTHAVNPNFSDVYLENHKPKLNTGLAIKLDPNAHTTSDGVSTALIEQLAKVSGNELQYFHIRNDSRSGGTIGPALSSATGIRAVDAGIPQLSMHSVRATTGSQDLSLGIKLFSSFFDKWTQVDRDFKRGGICEPRNRRLSKN